MLIRKVAPDIRSISVDSLKKDHTRIHYFGLGFIQVKLGEASRMHFYSKELPAFVETPHNHRYDFVSNILSGTFINTLWADDPNGEEFLIDVESCVEGQKPQSAPRTARLSTVHEVFYKAGQSYFMDSQTMHTVAADEAITFLRRGGLNRIYADVARPIGEETVCPFSKKVPESTLWEIVDSMLKKSIDLNK